MPKTANRTAKLLDVQKELISRLKTENNSVYEWLVRHQVDFSDLQKHSANFVAAASMLIQSTGTSIVSLPITDQSQIKSVSTITPTRKLSATVQGQKVWAQYGQLIRESAAEYGLDPNLIFATIMIESGGNARAIRQEPRLHDASYGLGQLLYSTARGIGYRGTPEGLFDPATNIDLIARYHRRNLDHYGHLTGEQLTTAYNTGSPYKRPYPGHLSKFRKWYQRIENLEVDLT